MDALFQMLRQIIFTCLVLGIFEGLVSEGKFKEWINFAGGLWILVLLIGVFVEVKEMPKDLPSLEFAFQANENFSEDLTAETQFYLKENLEKDIEQDVAQTLQAMLGEKTDQTSNHLMHKVSVEADIYFNLKKNG